VTNVPPPIKPLRADARRNRERVLAAARETFATHGLDAQVDEIARTANVGVGTVYRHFPTKDALVDALAADHFAWIAEESRTSAATVADGGDAWDAFSGFIWACARQLAADAGLSEIAANRPAAMRHAVLQTDLLTTAAEVIDRAVADGTMRTDATVDDIPVVMCGLGKILSEPSREMGMSWERYVTLMLDGMRPRADASA
jgi:AcrR family transcriptional regulator